MAERHPELDAEQAHLDWAYACLNEARERAARVTQGYDPQRGGTEQHRHERESIVEGAVNRLTQLTLGDRSLVDRSVPLDTTWEESPPFALGRVPRTLTHVVHGRQWGCRRGPPWRRCCFCGRRGPWNWFPSGR